MAAKQPTFQSVQEQARQGFAKAQLADPDSHFPYKQDQAREALATPPDPGTNNHPEHWYTSEDIIAASAAMVAAQETFLREPGGATQEAYEQAKRELVAARQAHRVGRGPAPQVLAGPPEDVRPGLGG